METVALDREQIATIAAKMMDSQVQDGVNFAPGQVAASIVDEMQGQALPPDLLAVLLGAVATLVRYESERSVLFGDQIGDVPSPALH